MRGTGSRAKALHVGSEYWLFAAVESEAGAAPPIVTDTALAIGTGLEHGLYSVFGAVIGTV